MEINTQDNLPKTLSAEMANTISQLETITKDNFSKAIHMVLVSTTILEETIMKANGFLEGKKG